MQTHLGRARVIIDEACFRRVRIARDLLPEVEQHKRHRGPRLARYRVCGLIAVAALLVGHPAERPAIRHAHRHRFAGAGYGRREERRRFDHGSNGLKQRHLLRQTEVLYNRHGISFFQIVVKIVRTSSCDVRDRQFSVAWPSRPDCRWRRRLRFAACRTCALYIRTRPACPANTASCRARGASCRR